MIKNLCLIYSFIRLLSQNRHFYLILTHQNQTSERLSLVNTSKLHVIAQSLLNELKRTTAVNSFNDIRTQLQNTVQQPNQPVHQQQLVTSLQTLYSSLENSPVENYSPAWKDAMQDLGVIDEFGINLKNKIQKIFEQNQITPNVALEKIQKIHTEIDATQTNLDSLVKGLSFFGVGEDELSNNECEVGVIVPRKYVNNNLKEFGKELSEIEKTLGVFSELATGTREPISIRNISSSELSVFLDYAPEVGACIAITIERIVAFYKTLLEIKKIKSDAAKQEMPNEILEQMNQHIESLVAPKIEDISQELFSKYEQNIEASRQNEILIELKHSINKLANRIDRGFNIELRISEENSASDESTQNESGNINPMQQIKQSSQNINFIHSQDEPILFLDEKDDETND